ncbi:hypothetical protein DUNSADRAFT_17636 [Dunaliella salina]|uniref:Encoded protein n=1 Tax=Dunaliella salina TaxID=3046 RepID=A0ABQ7GZZ9_DUNSA|nr:hypothetical protein DUNSADRAFT_17636 [Dunaliella salina]|eukprot:KAF5840152.1 hypothetical protein DUNSADRAFT_17636 [Dunaliella salina]
MLDCCQRCEFCTFKLSCAPLCRWPCVARRLGRRMWRLLWMSTGTRLRVGEIVGTAVDEHRHKVSARSCFQINC